MVINGLPFVIRRPDAMSSFFSITDIDKYYEPYARTHSVSGKEIVRILKREFKLIKNKPSK